MSNGTLEWSSARGGYGFILPDEGDLFVDITAVERAGS
jgi:cold shock CspA family protein